jgi:hypothetical protein
MNSVLYRCLPSSFQQLRRINQQKIVSPCLIPSSSLSISTYSPQDNLQIGNNTTIVLSSPAITVNNNGRKAKRTASSL